MATIAVIIATYRRYEDLTLCIASILKQSRLPEQLIIVDDDCLVDVPLQQQCEQQGIEVVYFKKDQPGLTASRNRGVALSHCDLLYFLDDDVELLDDYIVNIENIFAQDPQGDIAGVGGVIVNDPPLTRAKKWRRIFDRCFMITGPVEGKVLPSGFCVNYGSTGQVFDRPTAVDFLAGGVCAYRRVVFERFLFDENFKGYGLGEDKDFSYRLSKHHRLVVTPDARLNHYESAKMRYDTKRMGYEFVLCRYRFFRTHIYQRPLQSPAFYYALFGYTMSRTLISCLSFKMSAFSRLSGIMAAIGHIISGKAKQELLHEQNQNPPFKG